MSNAAKHTIKFEYFQSSISRENRKRKKIIHYMQSAYYFLKRRLYYYDSLQVTLVATHMNNDVPNEQNVEFR